VQSKRRDLNSIQLLLRSNGKSWIICDGKSHFDSALHLDDDVSTIGMGALC
jgi:hypothetical protein